jgi:hypothetical protein
MMKLSALALIGATNAAEDLFLDDSMAIETLQVGSGMCINWKKDLSTFYDLKNFDAERRDEKKNTPASVSNGDIEFFYKTCQSAWTMTEKRYATGSL